MGKESDYYQQAIYNKQSDQIQQLLINPFGG